MLEAAIINSKVTHTASVIFLHGLGDSGHSWSSTLALKTSQLPHIKWIFPHATAQPVAINNGLRMPAWYDIRSLTDRSKEDDKGALESAVKVRELIQKEIDSGISSNRIAVGGFSQGAAMSLLTLLTCDKKLGAVFGLSGYLPLHAKYEQIRKSVNEGTEVFLGHGTDDSVVQYTWGSMSAEFLKLKGYKVDFRSYMYLEHSANEQEIDDLFKFLEKSLP